MAVLGQPRTVHHRWKFLVEIDFFSHAAFQRCSELSFETATVVYWEGGSVIPIKDAGRATFTDITLERGTDADLGFFSWARDTTNPAILVPKGGRGGGLPYPGYKRNLDIVQLDRDNSELRRWHVYAAFPLKFVAGEWDNTADEVTIEQLVLGYDFFQPEQ